MLTNSFFWTTVSETTTVTTYSDNFNSYANGSKLGDAANWDSEYSDLYVSNATGSAGSVYPNSAGEIGAYYSAGTFSANQWSQATFKSIIAGRCIGVAVRCSGVGSHNYYGWYTSASNSYLFRVTNGAYFAFATGPAWTVNDVVKLEVVGDELRCYRNGSLDTTIDTDGKYTDDSVGKFSTGRPGLTGYGTHTDVLIDDWSAGDA